MDNQKICEQIVEAATERFKHYGYGKTTMAEIATDCNMSPGNLYRYFTSKLDIAEAMAKRNQTERIEEYKAVARDPNLTPTEKLTEFLMRGLEMTHDLIKDNPKIHEVAQILIAERPDFAQEQLTRELSLLVEILSAGNATREFDIDDVNFTAEMILSATMRYKYPQIYSNGTLDQYKYELRGIIDLMLNGLLHKGAHPEPKNLH